MNDAGSRILASCVDLGFALAGICDAGASSRGHEYRAWLAAGRHGTMEYLERDAWVRMDPALVLEGARSVVMVADLYRARAVAAEPREVGQVGRVARYAQGDDYHDVMKRRLHALADSLRGEHEGHEFRAFVDTAPLPERELAARAGLGWIGKHTLLINPAIGSYVLLGGLLTTLELVGTRAGRLVSDHCGTCTRCIDACPTGAISPYSVDASRCVSYLTIESRAVIPAEFHAGIGDWIFGCDICQDVCPHNSASGFGSAGRRLPVRSEILPAYESRRGSLSPIEVLGWTAEDRARELKGSSMKRARLDMLKRNAAIVLGNLVAEGKIERETAVAALRRLAGDEAEGEIARDAAREALRRVGEP